MSRVAGSRLKVISRPTAAERAKERRKLGRLESQLVQPKTKARYQECFTSLCLFLREREDFVVSDWGQFDQRVASYLEELWESGASKSEASYSLAALQFHRPEAKRSIPYCWKLMKAWEKAELPLRAYPMPPEMLLAFAGVLAHWNQLSMAQLLIVGYSLFLRTGELLALTGADVHFSGDKRPVVFIPSPKGSHHSTHTAEKLVVQEELASSCLRHLCKSAGNGRLCPVPPHKFREVWRDVVHFLGLGDLHLLPYALRRGGATSAFKNGASLDTLLLRGRWKNVSTARIYLDEALMELGQIQLAPSVHQKLKKFAHRFSVSQKGSRGG